MRWSAKVKKTEVMCLHKSPHPFLTGKRGCVENRSITFKLMGVGAHLPPFQVPQVNRRSSSVVLVQMLDRSYFFFFLTQKPGI